VLAAGLLAVASPAAAATLTSLTWSTSKTATGATAVTYRYTFTTASPSSLSSITMTVPSGTTGTPAVASVSPATISSGTVALASNTLTYSFTATTVATGTAVSISISGLTNTSTASAPTSMIMTKNGATPVDTGTTGSVTFTSASAQLTSLGWSASSTTVGATGVSYTYTFKTATLATITSITMTVPPGTGGTPTLGTVTPITLLGRVSLAGNVLTLSGVSVAILPGTSVSIGVNGLTNTATAGSYTTEIVTNVLGAPVDSGIAGPVSFTGTLTLTSPSSLTWATTLTGSTQNVADPTSADQQFTASDQTASGAGWHLTVSATTFTNGTKTLPNSGTFVMTGSLSSITSTTAPSATCNPSCVPPVNTTSYPVAITTAASSPTPATVFDTSASSGLGPMTIGGSSPADPVGWWVVVPGSAISGHYASTITVAIVSGP
jgi:hypothetical protein